MTLQQQPASLHQALVLNINDLHVEVAKSRSILEDQDSKTIRQVYFSLTLTMMIIFQ